MRQSGSTCGGPGLLRAALVLVMMIASCTGGLDKSADFDRHRHSQLVQPHDHPDRLYFDVEFSADFPKDDSTADAQRMLWLETWLKQTQLCPSGFEVVSRRPFDFLEDNPGGYQQRWDVRCRGSK